MQSISAEGLGHHWYPFLLWLHVTRINQYGLVFLVGFALVIVAFHIGVCFCTPFMLCMRIGLLLWLCRAGFLWFPQISLQVHYSRGSGESLWYGLQIWIPLVFGIPCSCSMVHYLLPMCQAICVQHKLLACDVQWLCLSLSIVSWWLEIWMYSLRMYSR